MALCGPKKPVEEMNTDPEQPWLLWSYLLAASIAVVDEGIAAHAAVITQNFFRGDYKPKGTCKVLNHVSPLPVLSNRILPVRTLRLHHPAGPDPSLHLASLPLPLEFGDALLQFVAIRSEGKRPDRMATL